MKKGIILGLILLVSILSADVTALDSELKSKTNGESPQLNVKLGTIIDKVNEEVANTAKDSMTITAGTITTLGSTTATLGTVTVTTGLTQTPVASVPLDAGVAIPANASMVDITSSTADAYVLLPTPVRGHQIVFLPSATGYEIRPALQTQYINGTECTPNKELAVPADSMMTATAVVSGAAGKWIITQQDDDGTTDAGGTPD